MMTNQSALTEVVLVGFPSLPLRFYIPVSLVMFLVYITSFFANSMVIGLIILTESLHKPMYIAIANLASSDLLFDTITLPKIIARYWFDDGTMSFAACLFQVFWVHNLGTLDAFLLMVMAMDRYVAISRPLHYSSLISNKHMVVACILCVCVSSTAGFICIIFEMILVFTCGRTRIDSCFCTNNGILALACVDISFSRWATFGLAITVLLLPLGFILFSYIAILKLMYSSTQMVKSQKALYTCTTHLLVIALYYAPRLFVYISGQTKLILNADVNVLLLCLYTFIPHMANPIIYGLRTKEITQTFKNVIKKPYPSKYLNGG